MKKHINSLVLTAVISLFLFTLTGCTDEEVKQYSDLAEQYPEIAAQYLEAEEVPEELEPEVKKLLVAPAVVEEAPVVERTLVAEVEEVPEVEVEEEPEVEEVKPSILDEIEGDLEVGNIVSLGHYSEVEEENTWYVVSNDDEKIELLSVYVIDIWNGDNCNTFLSDADLEEYEDVTCGLQPLQQLVDTCPRFVIEFNPTYFVLGTYADPKIGHLASTSTSQGNTFCDWTAVNSEGDVRYICSAHTADNWVYCYTSLGGNAEGMDRCYYTTNFRPMLTITK